MAVFLTFSPTSHHIHPLQVENCDCNSRLVVDEDQAFPNLNPRWSGWPRRQTQTVFGTMSQTTNMFVTPLSSNHRGFRRYRSFITFYYYYKVRLERVNLWPNVCKFWCLKTYFVCLLISVMVKPTFFTFMFAHNSSLYNDIDKLQSM